MTRDCPAQELRCQHCRRMLGKLRLLSSSWSDYRCTLELRCSRCGKLNLFGQTGAPKPKQRLRRWRQQRKGAAARSHREPRESDSIAKRADVSPKENRRAFDRDGVGEA